MRVTKPPESATMSVEEASKLLGEPAGKIRRWLIKRLVPWGFADKPTDNKNYEYIVIRHALYNWIEHGDVSVVNQVVISNSEFDTLARVIVNR